MTNNKLVDYLKEKGISTHDIKKDSKGYYYERPSRVCTDKNGTCEADERCDCMDKIYLPDEIQF